MPLQKDVRFTLIQTFLSHACNPADSSGGKKVPSVSAMSEGKRAVIVGTEG